MDIFETIAKRKSVRRFEKEKKIKREDIERLLEAAIEAPSAGNLQVWRFWVVLSQNLKEKIAQAAYYQDFIAEAPVVIVVGADLMEAFRGYGERGKSVYALQDTAAAVENILLAACALGLGSCWVGAFDEKRVKQALNLSDNLRPLAILPVGYPLDLSKKPPRKPLSQVVAWLE